MIRQCDLDGPRIVSLPASKANRTLARLTKWAGFTYDFAGSLSSSVWSGYKLAMPKGGMEIHLWKRR
jgi:hypothetical protein